MNLRLSTITITVAAALLATSAAFAQSEDGPILTTVRFRKITDQNYSGYVRNESKFWKKLHQPNVQSKRQYGWQVLVAVAPSGPDVSPDAMTFNMVRLNPDGSSPNEGGPGGQIMKLRAEEGMEEIYQEGLKASNLVRSEMWRLVDEVRAKTPKPAEDVPVFAAVNYMKIPQGQGANYATIRKEWKALHQKAVDEGFMRGWQAFAVYFPSGTQAEYGMVTIDIYETRKFLNGRRYDEFFKKAFPSGDFDDLGRRTGEARQIVRSELYRIVTELR